MSEMGEMFGAIRAVQQQERQARAATAPVTIATLESLGYAVATLSPDGPHLRVDARFDFWPSTERWVAVGGGRRGKGLDGLLKALSAPRGRSLVKTDRRIRSRRR